MSETRVIVVPINLWLRSKPEDYDEHYHRFEDGPCRCIEGWSAEHFGLVVRNQIREEVIHTTGCDPVDMNDNPAIFGLSTTKAQKDGLILIYASAGVGLRFVP